VNPPSANASAQAEKAFDSGIRRIRARALLTMIAITLVFGAIILVLWLGRSALPPVK
jgi:ATP-binding cassette subfamily B protein